MVGSLRRIAAESEQVFDVMQCQPTWHLGAWSPMIGIGINVWMKFFLGMLHE